MSDGGESAMAENTDYDDPTRERTELYPRLRAELSAVEVDQTVTEDEDTPLEQVVEEMERLFVEHNRARSSA